MHSSKEPEQKPQKTKPETSKKAKTSPKTPKAVSVKKEKSSPAVAKKEKSSPAIIKTESAVKSESPENKPLNGQSKEVDEKPIEDEVKKDEGKVLKIQSAGAGQAGADYNPSKKNYHPINDAFWKQGEK